jgi:septal ring factor EnvC (AmiA/AmiB activator)
VETRLDRIEKALETLLVGIAELKESQKKTDAQILDLKQSQKKTDEQLSRTDSQILDLKGIPEED